MPKVARLGDICTGHGCWSPRPSSSGSPNVKVNGIPIHRVGDSWSVHCCPTIPECHSGVLASGSSSVKVNGIAVGRVGDPVSCGGVVATHSPNVSVGG